MSIYPGIRRVLLKCPKNKYTKMNKILCMCVKERGSTYSRKIKKRKYSCIVKFCFALMPQSISIFNILVNILIILNKYVLLKIAQCKLKH